MWTNLCCVRDRGGLEVGQSPDLLPPNALQLTRLPILDGPQPLDRPNDPFLALPSALLDGDDHAAVPPSCTVGRVALPARRDGEEDVEPLWSRRKEVVRLLDVGHQRRREEMEVCESRGESCRGQEGKKGWLGDCRRRQRDHEKRGS